MSKWGCKCWASTYGYLAPLSDKDANLTYQTCLTIQVMVQGGSYAIYTSSAAAPVGMDLVSACRRTCLQAQAAVPSRRQHHLPQPSSSRQEVFSTACLDFHVCPA